MFKLSEVELIHWDYWHRIVVPMNGNIITIVGPNGSGKTTFVDACRTLLAIDCSKDRNYQKYLRNTKAKVGWIRAVVDNPRRSNGSRAFFPIVNEQITLVCRIRKAGGDWERKYAIVPGNESVETIDSKKEVSWIGVREYETRLRDAGITRAMRKVLALDQGETDKLCEFTGSDLLRLVFETFGDQAVLDEYERARREYTEAEKELQETRRQVNLQDSEVDRLKLKRDAYLNWKEWKARVLKFESEILPVALISEAWNAWENAAKGRRQYNLKKIYLKEDQTKLFVEQQKAQQELNQARAELKTIADAFEVIDQELKAARETRAGLEEKLNERTRLLEMVKLQEQGFDAISISEELSTLRGDIAGLKKELKDSIAHEQALKSRRQALSRKGAREHWPEVLTFMDALTAAGISHAVLSDRLDVKDLRWQSAVEGFLGARRAIILLDKAVDEERALELGQQYRYRAYITPDTEKAFTPTNGMLSMVMEIQGKIPRWIFELLDSVVCVETVAEGMAKTRNNRGLSWITPDGYCRERRGGRYVGVSPDEFLLGEQSRLGKISAIDRQLSELLSRRSALEREQRVKEARASDLQGLLDGQDAAQVLAARSEEFASAQAQADQLRDEINRITERHDHQKNEKSRVEGDVLDIQEKKVDLEAKLRTATQQLVQVSKDWQSRKELALARFTTLRGLLNGAPASWRSPESRTAILTAEKFENSPSDQIRQFIDEKKSWLDRTASDHTENIELMYEKNKADLEHLKGILTEREAMRERTLHLVDQQRARYINVLKSSASVYLKNVRTLAEMAGIEAMTKPLAIENTDISINQAALDITFRFDEKHQADVSAGDSSGGQKVMKSMILLIALLMDEDRPAGIIFIDEPFAHLDIFNIDRVSSFLQRTQAQYLITTPITHNANIYTPSQITLVTQKVRPGQTHAPPIGVAVRRKTGTHT